MQIGLCKIDGCRSTRGRPAQQTLVQEQGIDDSCTWEEAVLEHNLVLGVLFLV